MNTFLLKINGDTRCPEGVNVPETTDDWASGAFSSRRTKNQMSVFADGTAGPCPDVGDKAYIWVNENGNDSRGRGLTAVATIKSIADDGDRYDFILEPLSLLKNMISMDRAVATLPDSIIINEMARRRHERTWALTDLDERDFDALVTGAGGLRAEPAIHPLETALASQASKVNAALQERKATTAKARPGQSTFRQAALERHSGRCVFTKTKVREVLEAAHVIPHTGAPAFERPDNGLLLRRDVHALFDLFLLSINPQNHQIVVSEALRNSMYAKLAGRVVEHKLAFAALNFHSEQFLKEDRS